jgi:hypothetical protein
MARSMLNSVYFSDDIQADFLNLLFILVAGKSSNLKIWRLSKNAQTLVLSTTCAIFNIHN